MIKTVIEIHGNLQFDAVKLQQYLFISTLYIQRRNSNHNIYRFLHCSVDKLQQICQTLISGNKTMKQT